MCWTKSWNGKSVPKMQACLTSIQFYNGYNDIFLIENIEYMQIFIFGKWTCLWKCNRTEVAWCVIKWTKISQTYKTTCMLKDIFVKNILDGNSAN